MKTHDAEVLVVGLGPVGSVAALQLAQQGVRVAAIEAHAGQRSDLRASVYQYRDRQSGDMFSFDLT